MLMPQSHIRHDLLIAGQLSASLDSKAHPSAVTVKTVKTAILDFSQSITRPNLSQDSLRSSPNCDRIFCDWLFVQHIIIH